MTKLNSYSRLKVKRDTFYLPDPQGGVYFRNNVSSFRMEGGTIYQWIEKLIPMFNGEQTLGDLTEGLTARIGTGYMRLEKHCTRMALFGMQVKIVHIN